MDKPKFKNVKSPSQIKKIAVRMPKYMRDEISKKMVDEGYNFRQKSKWVSEAVEYMISRPDWEGALMSQSNVDSEIQDVVTFPIELYEMVNQEVRRLISSKPFLNPSQSAIIRTAIQRRCMGIHLLGNK